MAFGAGTANAASNAAAAGQAVVSVSMQQLNERVATVPALASLKDGVVTITPTPAETEGDPLPGTLDAGYVTSDENINNGAYSQVIRTLISDTSDLSVLRIPDNAWLFRVNGSGQYTALEDVFVYESGSQPVPVAAWYWQAQ